MKTARIFGISYAIIAFAVALLTTVMQTQPALFFIDLLTYQRKFSLTLVLLLTALLLLLPGVLLIAIISFLRKKKNVIPDLAGKTGLLFHRKRALYNAVYNYRVIIDGTERGTLANGQSLFVEITSGKHIMAIKGFDSSETEFDLKFGSVVKFEVQIIEEGIKANVVLVLQHNDQEQ